MNASKVLSAASIVMLLCIARGGVAQVSAQEAEALKTTLTPLGAERAGDKSGTIPAWTGCDNQKAASITGRRPDPFANEKPLFSITAKNVGEYKDALTDGQLALFAKYTDYRMDVYPTHRTACAPDWVYANVAKNAMSAKVANDGDTLTGALGGIPFPIPKSGVQVMWNHQLRWEPDAVEYNVDAVAVTTDNKQVLLSRGDDKELRPYYFEEADPQAGL
jgi:hypothetical protein